MGSAIEVFDGAATVAVGRERFVPVKTTDDLLVLRSDCYELDDHAVLHQVPDEVPFIDLSGVYKLVHRFDERFPDGVPSLKDATSLVVAGDYVFGADVTVVGEVELEDTGAQEHVEAGTRLG